MSYDMYLINKAKPLSGNLMAWKDFRSLGEWFQQLHIERNGKRLPETINFEISKNDIEKLKEICDISLLNLKHESNQRLEEYYDTVKMKRIITPSEFDILNGLEYKKYFPLENDATFLFDMIVYTFEGCNRILNEYDFNNGIYYSYWSDDE